MKLKNQLTLIIAVLFLVGGCGYTTKTEMPAGIKTIYVPTFTNQIEIENLYTYRGGLETDITNAIIKRFLFDGNLKVVNDPDKADATLKGELKSFFQNPLRFNQDEEIEEVRVFLQVSIKLIDNRTGKVLIEEPSMVARDQRFLVGPTARSQGQSIEKITDDLARFVVDRIVEDW